MAALTAAAQQHEPLIRHVSELASPGYGGRLAGTRGERRAAHYLARRLVALGAEPLPGRDSYYEEFPLPESPARQFRTGINVLGWLPATLPGDSATSPAIVLLGAHYDHIGDGLAIDGAARTGKSGPLHPGADDNASGVAVVLGAAGRLAIASRPHPVLVAFWSGEESGLLGSRHFVQNWDFAARPVGLVLTADMVGRLRGAGVLRIDATHLPDAERARLRALAESDGLPVEFLPPGSLSTDSHSFSRASIPAIVLTTGLHGDYERQSDTPEGIDAAGLERLGHFLAAFAGAGSGQSP